MQAKSECKYFHVVMQAIRFFMSSNLTVKGLKIQTSPQFRFQFDECKNVLINTIVINSPPHSPNTDGILVENWDSVGIYNSVISNGNPLKLLNIFILNPTSRSHHLWQWSSYRRRLNINRVGFIECRHKIYNMWTRPLNQVCCSIRFEGWMFKS